MKFLTPLLLCALAAHSANLPLAQEGKQVFAMSCAVGYCHGVDGRAGKGPRLRDRTWTRVYLYNTIEKGIAGSSMPAWQGRLSEHNIDAVIAYVLSIGKEQSDAASTKEAIAETPVVSPQAALGKVLFFDLTRDRNCGVCHRVGDSGTPVAAAFPPFAGVSQEDVLRRIVNAPSSARNVQATTSNGETICGVEAAKTPAVLRIYDLSGAGPPVLRSIDPDSVQKMGPCAGVNPHEENSRFYTNEELRHIAEFLRGN